MPSAHASIVGSSEVASEVRVVDRDSGDIVDDCKYERRLC
jgi:hypothetical protein